MKDLYQEEFFAKFTDHPIWKSEMEAFNTDFHRQFIRHNNTLLNSCLPKVTSFSTEAV